MSYTELDAWLDEKALGDWPFDRWECTSFDLHKDVNYFSERYCGPNTYLFYKLRNSFGDKDPGRLASVLGAACETINVAIEVSEDDAHATWLRHEVWLSAIDERLTASDNPAELLIESIDYVGTPEGYREQELYAGLGLWLLGEWWLFDRAGDDDRKNLALNQAFMALAEAEFYRGVATAEGQTKLNISKRNKDASRKRHEKNHENKKKGLAVWLSRQWSVQADAERAIAQECSITKEVAGRWVREYKRAKS